MQMHFRWAIVLVTLLISLIHSEEYRSDNCPVQINYKSWFFNPPAGAVVGFPLRAKTADADSYDRYCSYARMRANGVLHFYERNGKHTHKQDSLSFFYDPNQSSTSPSDLKVLDSLTVTKGHELFLYSPVVTEINNSTVSLCSSSPWGNNNEVASRTYGYGVIGLSYYDHVGSWVTAESDAIRDLLGKSAVLIASHRLNADNSFTEVVRYEYDLIVENIQVERRWVNFDDWSCHVVVSAPSSSITSWKGDTTDLLSDKAISTNSPKVADTSEEVNSVKADVDSEKVLVHSDDDREQSEEDTDNNLKIGSAEWYKRYNAAQKRQLDSASQSDAKNQKEFEKKQNQDFENFEKDL